MKTILVLLLFTAPVFAQSFYYKADVKPAKVTGYQRINLGSEVVGHLNDELGDMRLYDGQKHEIPYLLVRQTGTNGATFLPFTMVRKTSNNGLSTLILKRPNGRPIRTMSVVLKNAAVQKTASLSGGPDGRTWYALVSYFRLDGNNSDTSTEYTETISFPLTDYPYFRLQISDSTSTKFPATESTVVPLNIIRVGSYARINASAQYTPIPGLRFTQRDSSDHHTYLFINRPTLARIDRLSIRVSSPAQYHRKAEFGQVFTQTITRKRGVKRVEQSFEPAVHFLLTSAGDSTLQLPGVLTEKLCIRIDNADDPPLQIRAVNADQTTTYIVANLLADSTYTLRFGDKGTAPPVYDLAYFKGKLPPALPVATVGLVNDRYTLSPTPIISPYVLWLGIGAVLLLLGYMSYQMLGKIGEHKG